ncbi:MAG: phage tail protein [Cyanobacteria bacterium P01_F01_bin.150]
MRSPSSLLQQLPAIYQAEPQFGQFLLAFEKLLLGLEDQPPLPDNNNSVAFPTQGLEQTIAGLATYFDPQEAPEKFLEWLASWTALSLRADLSPQKQRDFISNIIQRYRYRGTKQNLQELLNIFIRVKSDQNIVITVTEPSPYEFQIGKNSTIGVDTLLGGGPPHHFNVVINVPRAEPEVQARRLAIAHAIIKLEKPAHTSYTLDFNFPSMQIGVHSTIGLDTILGTTTNNNTG